MRVVTTRRGARLVEAGTVLSEVLAEPGPTHTFFDVLAAAVAALSPGRRVALLGFAGGGLVAPLRAMGFPFPLEAVDLSLEGAGVFRGLSSRWAGRVAVSEDDAALWLARRRGRYDLILEDLFAGGPRGMVKPEVSFTTLPPLMRRRLRRSGVAVFNTLPEPGKSWQRVREPLLRPFSRSCTVLLDEYENRLLLAGAGLPGAREVSRRLRESLGSIGSRQAGRIRVMGAPV